MKDGPMGLLVYDESDLSSGQQGLMDLDWLRVPIKPFENDKVGVGNENQYAYYFLAAVLFLLGASIILVVRNRVHRRTTDICGERWREEWYEHAETILGDPVVNFYMMWPLRSALVLLFTSMFIFLGSRGKPLFLTICGVTIISIANRPVEKFLTRRKANRTREEIERGEISRESVIIQALDKLRMVVALFGG